MTGCGSGGKKAEGSLSFSPEKPEAGNEVIFTYIPQKEPFVSAEKITMLAYSYTSAFPEVAVVEMKKSGESWTGTVQTGKDTCGLALKFQTGEDFDNNSGQGYFLFLFDVNGAPVPGARAGLAEMYASWGERILGMEPDNIKAISLFEEEFQSHPEMLSKYFYTFVRALRTEKPDGWETRTMDAVDLVSENVELGEEELNRVINAYRMLAATEKMNAAVDRAKERFPSGYQVQNVHFSAFNEEKDPTEKWKMLERFKADFPESNMIGTMSYYVVTGFLAQNKMDELKAFTAAYAENFQDYAYGRIASMLLQRKSDLDFALDMADTGIARLTEQLENPKEEKPAYLTDEEWKIQVKKYSLSSLVQTKGQILREQGNNEAALPVLEEAFSLSNGTNPSINESYAASLMDAEMFQKAMDVLAGCIKDGSSTAGMKDLLQQAYVRIEGNKDGFPDYFEELDNAATEKLRAELMKDMLDLPAPAFSLEDLDGNTISLADLKGKTFVLDFWATWCGPCISSFPAMNRARELYAEDEHVEFLFINTWQKEEDKKANAQNFIDGKNYPFHVLLDLDDAVVAAYKVRGIPTKFIVDKNGRIRFTKIGFDGNDDKTVKELNLMIEMVK